MVIDTLGEKGFSDLFRQISADLPVQELREAAGYVFGQDAKDLKTKSLPKRNIPIDGTLLNMPDAPDTIDAAVQKSGWV